MPVAEGDRAKTAIITPSGLYQFRPASIQRMMDGVLHGLESFTADYTDDIIIFSESWNDHIGHI